LVSQACAFVKLPYSLRAATAIWSPHRRAETTISVYTLILSKNESETRPEKPQAPLLDAACAHVGWCVRSISERRWGRGEPPESRIDWGLVQQRALCSSAAVRTRVNRTKTEGACVSDVDSSTGPATTRYRNNPSIPELSSCRTREPLTAKGQRISTPMYYSWFSVRLAKPSQFVRSTCYNRPSLEHATGL
jgi:hypothetical protein